MCGYAKIESRKVCQDTEEINQTKTRIDNIALLVSDSSRNEINASHFRETSDAQKYDPTRRASERTHERTRERVW